MPATGAAFGGLTLGEKSGFSLNFGAGMPMRESRASGSPHGSPFLVYKNHY